MQCEIFLSSLDHTTKKINVPGVKVAERILFIYAKLNPGVKYVQVCPEIRAFPFYSDHETAHFKMCVCILQVFRSFMLDRVNAEVWHMHVRNRSKFVYISFNFKSKNASNSGPPEETNFDCQGMNEVLGPIYYVLASDPDEEWAEHAEVGWENNLKLLASILHFVTFNGTKKWHITSSLSFAFHFLNLFFFRDNVEEPDSGERSRTFYVRVLQFQEETTF